MGGGGGGGVYEYMDIWIYIKTQAKLVRTALGMAAEAGLRVWSVTIDGTIINISMFRELGCNFTTSLQTMITKFKHPTQDYFVYAVLQSVTLKFGTLV